MESRAYDRDNTNKIAHHFFELHGGSWLTMNGSSNTFQYVPILLHRCNPACFVWLQNGASMSMPDNGVVLNRDSGMFYMDNSTADLYALRASGCGKSCQNILINNNSLLKLNMRLRLYDSRLHLRNNSTLITQDKMIEVCNGDGICLGSGATLKSGNGTYSVTGPASYTAAPGKGKCDNATAGYSDWYRTSASEVCSACGYYSDFTRCP